MQRMTLAAVLLTLFLAGCAGSGAKLDVVASTSRGVDLDDFRTWNFMQPLGTDRSGTHTPISSMLMNSMTREMADRGLRRSGDSPDLLVDFIVAAEETVDLRESPASITLHRSHWPAGYSVWPDYQKTAGQYAQGTLIVDIIDVSNEALVAEGATEGPISSNQFTQTQSDEVIRKIVKDIW